MMRFEICSFALLRDTLKSAVMALTLSNEFCLVLEDSSVAKIDRRIIDLKKLVSIYNLLLINSRWRY